MKLTKENILKDLASLPSEIKSELLILKKKAKKLELGIEDVLNDLGDANIDMIIVGLFKKHDLKPKRQFLSNKLYRMVAKGRLVSIVGKKGVYQLNDKNL